MRGGKRAGSERKTGVPNKLTAALREKLNAGGIAQVMRDPHQDLGVRLETAKAAAPYLHPRLQAVEHSGTDENTASRHWVVELVASPKHANTAPSDENSPSNEIARLQGPGHPSAGTIISCEVNGVGVPTNRRWLG
jgi:hypothetical protein